MLPKSDLLQKNSLFDGKAASPAATAVNNAGTRKARPPMHDDSGATTGLRSHPDYGESDSYTVEMNEANSKGASAAFVVEVQGGFGVKDAGSGPMYIMSVEFDSNDALKVAKFSFGPDRQKATLLHKMTADDLARQISSPAFGMQARSILAYNYEDMFKAVERLAPNTERPIKEQIDWGKKILKKQDRIVWYLRWYRIALVNSLIANEKKRENFGFPSELAKQGAAPATAMPQQTMGEQPPAQRPQVPTAVQRLEALLQQYKNEVSVKGGNSEVMITLDDFPAMKRSLEHFYNLPVPDIQNRVLKAETYGDVYAFFSSAEQAWKEQAKRLLRPHEDDKIWMQFPDGWAWWWLPRASCDEESKAMGHCGNSPMAGKSGVSILSLRQPKNVGKETLWEPHLTFILHGTGDNGTLGEMKGKNNDKPVPAYHKYIIPLLKDGRIAGVQGGGYLPEHNFSLGDITDVQRKEVYDANPSIGMSMAAYYQEHGMDEKLFSRVKQVLELEDGARYDGSYGVILREWDDEDAFVADCGDRDMKAAWRFAEDGESPLSDPDGDELADMVDKLADENKVYYVGLTLQYHYANNMRTWYVDQAGNPTFDPRDVDNIKQVVLDLYEVYVKPKISKSKTPEAAFKEDIDRIGKPKTEKKKSPFAIPVIQEFWNAYMGGGPDQDAIGEYVNDAIRQAGEGESYSIEYGDTVMQVLDDDSAISSAEKVQSTQRPIDIGKPHIAFPADWDDWSDERAAENLAYFFEKPPKRPAVEKQRRLFTEPKTEEQAKRRGITVSKLKSPLLRSKQQITKG